MRKVREAAGALLLDARFDKRTLLESYLNEVYLAQDGATAIHGVEAASRHIFGKPAAALDVAESALLAGMLQAPSVYSPLRHPNAARARRSEVLARLRDAGGSRGGGANADAQPLVDPLRAANRIAVASRSISCASGSLTALGAETLAQGGLEIRATLDERLQAIAEEAMRTGLRGWSGTWPALRADGMRLEAALVAIDLHSGALRALVGGRDYDALVATTVL